jgi:transcriptional regulator with XRE-family HTH domain
MIDFISVIIRLLEVVNLKDINLGDIITAKRREKGVTQDELAAFVGVSKASVSKWERGLSYPDITLLPVLASYFNISIDKLIGYAPQLGKDEIKRIYKKLSVGFAESPFEEVMAECELLVKKYYSCYPFLLEMVQLYINHANLAGNPERKNEMLRSAVAICNRIKTECSDPLITNRVPMYEAMCYLLMGDAQGILTALGENMQPIILPGTLISQAYQMLGKPDKAIEVIQIELYQNIMGVFSGLISYMQANIGNYDKAITAFKRAESLSELFQMRKLNPNNAALLYVLGAHICQAAKKDADTIEMLGKYVDVCIYGFFPYMPHGDEFFDRIDPWLAENVSSMPRTDALVKESMLNDVLLNPAFDSLHDNPEFTKLIRKLRDFIGGK